MRQAQTLNEAQFRRVLHYCRSRRHPVRDTTIFMVSFYAGLRAKEIASLKLGDVFDELNALCINPQLIPYRVQHSVCKIN